MSWVITASPWRLGSMRAKHNFPCPCSSIGRIFWFPTAGNYQDALTRTPPALYAAMLVGHSSQLYGAMDDVHRLATESEVTGQDSQRDCIDEGSIDVLSELFHHPPQAKKTVEVTAAAEVMAARDAIYTIQIQDEAERVMEALGEVAQIDRDASV